MTQTPAALTADTILIALVRFFANKYRHAICNWYCTIVYLTIGRYGPFGREWCRGENATPE